MTSLEYFKGDELADSVWTNKYKLANEETPRDMHIRLAYEFEKIERKYTKDIDSVRHILSKYGNERSNLSAQAIVNLFDHFNYIVPGGSVMSGLGSDNPVSLSNCFVIPSPKDSISSIFDTARDMAQIYKRRGGIGVDISKLRPNGSIVHNAANTSSGSISFMELYSKVTEIIGQSGRRGASLISIDIRHPDVLNFITCKSDLSKITGANISVKIDKEFRDAVNKDEDYILRWPIETPIPSHSETLEYKVLTKDTLSDNSTVYYKKVKAKELWNLLIENAWKHAEPGILIYDRLVDYDPTGVYDELRPISTNPCGEIGLSPYDSCRLICSNLFSLVENPFESDAKINYEAAYRVFYECQVLADDLVDLELEAIERILLKIQPDYALMRKAMWEKPYALTWLDNQSNEFKLWWKIKEMGEKGRRTGSGITALADMYAALGVEYGNKEITEKLFYTKLQAELDATIDMSIIRGSFPLWDSALEYIDSDLTGGNDWYTFIQEEFPEQYKRMVEYGRRNSSFSTVAPTGSISLLTGTTSGIEPLFKPYYIRRKKCNPGETPTFVDQNGVGFKEYTVLHPKFKEWFIITSQCKDCPDVALDSLKDASKEQLEEVFKESPWYKQTAEDINWEVRVDTQGIIQKYITSSISSTVNLPKGTSKEIVENLYNRAIDKGLKGITCYVDGSRSGILVDAKLSKTEELFEQHKAPKRPKVLKANSFTIKSLGNTYCVLVGLFQNKPYEVFVMKQPSVSLDKDGSITKINKHHYSWNDKNNTYIDNIITNLADESAEQTLALMVSMLLRTGAELQFIIKTIKKSTNTIVSFQSALVRVLSKYLTKPIETNELCPDCNTPLVNENGCCICKNCGYSKCG